MKTCLLYEDNDYLTDSPYFDSKSIIQDLGLNTLFLCASKKVIYEKTFVKSVKKEDPYILKTMQKVMMIPLRTEEQMLYRQEIVQDCINNEDMIRDLYAQSELLLAEWNKLGRSLKDKMGNRNPVVTLMNDIQLLSLFVNHLHNIRAILDYHHVNFKSRGLNALRDRLHEEFSNEFEQNLRKLLKDISFYTEGLTEEPDPDRTTITTPRIVLECTIENGLKLSSISLKEMSSEQKKFHKPGGAIDKVQQFMSSQIPDSFSTIKKSAVKEDISQLEFQVVNYIMSSTVPFMSSFSNFFDQLHQQTAFYVGALNLHQQIGRFDVATCYPTVCPKNELSFQDLKELVMVMEQRIKAISNSCSLKNKMLLIVTGANQGGKSTFLRSIGIAQIMMQSGLMVPASQYQSALFPSFFTHFTRREDSEMNSGRLDEELNRMNQIIDNIGENSLVLLNESFATTTEKDGSVIAYDIIKALIEADVKILTVTHLLNFAQRMYQETKEDVNTTVTFLSAERKENGERTFRMIDHAPELTSFGLDLYDSIVENRDKTE